MLYTGSGLSFARNATARKCSRRSRRRAEVREFFVHHSVTRRRFSLEHAIRHSETVLHRTRHTRTHAHTSVTSTATRVRVCPPVSVCVGISSLASDYVCARDGISSSTIGISGLGRVCACVRECLCMCVSVCANCVVRL